MSRDPMHKSSRIDQFFSGPDARADRWRDLADSADAWLAGSLDRAGFEEELADLTITEAYFAYPGGQLLSALRENAAADEAAATVHLVNRIVRAVMTRSFRQDAGDWDAGEDVRDSVPEIVPSSLTAREHHQPYFETLIVTGVPSFKALSPFEIKDELIQLAKNTSKTTQSAFLNAGRGNPNWVATAAREGFFLLGQFALTECRRVMEHPAGLAGMPQAKDIAARLESWLTKHADMPGAGFLSSMLQFATKTFSFDPDAGCAPLRAVTGTHSRRRKTRLRSERLASPVGGSVNEALVRIVPLRNRVACVLLRRSGWKPAAGMSGQVRFETAESDRASLSVNNKGGGLQ